MAAAGRGPPGAPRPGGGSPPPAHAQTAEVVARPRRLRSPRRRRLLLGKARADARETALDQVRALVRDAEEHLVPATEAVIEERPLGQVRVRPALRCVSLEEQPRKSPRRSVQQPG